MALIALSDYARLNGRDPATARQKAGRGGFLTAQRLGRDWVIDDAEPWPDHRTDRFGQKPHFEENKHE